MVFAQVSAPPGAKFRKFPREVSPGGRWALVAMPDMAVMVRGMVTDFVPVGPVREGEHWGNVGGASVLAQVNGGLGNVPPKVAAGQSPAGA